MLQDLTHVLAIFIGEMGKLVPGTGSFVAFEAFLREGSERAGQRRVVQPCGVASARAGQQRSAHESIRVAARDLQGA